jgi:hypothetical protein
LSSRELEDFIRNADPELVTLYAALARLFEVLDQHPPALRQAAAEAVYQYVEKTDLSVFEQAIEHWE